MKKHLLFIIVLVASALSIQAQHRNGAESKENMFKELKEFKIKYLAQELELDGDKTAEFIEIYGQQMDERHNLWEPVIKLERKVKEGNATDADYDALSNATDQAKAKDAALSAKYDARLRKVLTSKQIYKLKEAEDQFRNKMRQMRDKKGKGHKPRR